MNDTVEPSVSMKCEFNNKIAKINIYNLIFTNFLRDPESPRAPPWEGFGRTLLAGLRGAARDYARCSMVWGRLEIGIWGADSGARW